VGVGSNDFEKMVELDADQKVTKKFAEDDKKKKKKNDKKKKEQKDKKTEESNNHPLFERDIVQFVPFKHFEDKPYYELAKHTLAEVPRQVSEI
jgi:hypothetical protein